MPRNEPEALALIDTPEAARTLCGRLMETTAELISVLDRETGMIRKADTSELEALTLRKTHLSTSLMQGMKVLQGNAGYIGAAIPDDVAVIKEQNGQFQKSLKANQDSLMALKSVSEQLIRMIAEKAAERTAGPESYGANGAYNNATADKPAAISVNKSL